MDEKETLYQYDIPDNILESKRIFGFRRRNWVEGLISVLIVGFIICLIPFVTRVKIIFIVAICGPLLLLNLIGIKDQSLFEVAQNLKAAIDNSGNYHLRRPDNEEKYKSRRMEQSVNGVNSGDSAADKVAEFSKRKFEEIKSRYR